MSSIWAPRSTRDIFDSLVERALSENQHRVNWHQEQARYYGKPVPEDLLPGRLIMRLPATARAKLAELTAADTQDMLRLFFL